MGCCASRTSAYDDPRIDKYDVTLTGDSELQVGGHKGSIKTCICNPGKFHCIAKPLRNNEAEMYMFLRTTELYPFLPRYFGRYTLEGKQYIVLEDLTYGMANPYVMDLKIGTRHYGLDASQAKIDGLEEKVQGSTTPKYGVRLISCSMRIQKNVTEEWNKVRGLRFSYDELLSLIKRFLHSDSLRRQFASRLEAFETAFRTASEFYPGIRVYASSLLLCFDNKGKGDESKLVVKFIDFAHTYSDIKSSGGDPGDSSYDDGIMVGINSLLNSFSDRKTYRLVLIRHGESQWNLENRFTGWYDCDLSDLGRSEAAEAGKYLLKEGFKFDLAYTSVLKRATETLSICLENMKMTQIPIVNSWRLNERHYGGLTGLNKAETTGKYGEDQVKQWRRSFAIPPPPLDPESEFNPCKDPRYQGIDPALLPSCESLKDTIDRVLPLWDNEILPKVKEGKKIVIAAHGNSLRALMKHLERMTDDQICEVNLPTAVPLVYDLDSNLKVVGKRYVGDQNKIKEKIDAVANQAKKK